MYDHRLSGEAFLLLMRLGDCLDPEGCGFRKYIWPTEPPHWNCAQLVVFPSDRVYEGESACVLSGRYNLNVLVQTCCIPMITQDGPRIVLPEPAQMVFAARQHLGAVETAVDCIMNGGLDLCGSDITPKISYRTEPTAPDIPCFRTVIEIGPWSMDAADCYPDNTPEETCP